MHADTVQGLLGDLRPKTFMIDKFFVQVTFVSDQYFPPLTLYSQMATFSCKFKDPFKALEVDELASKLDIAGRSESMLMVH